TAVGCLRPQGGDQPQGEGRRGPYRVQDARPTRRTVPEAEGLLSFISRHISVTVQTRQTLPRSGASCLATARPAVGSRRRAPGNTAARSASPVPRACGFSAPLPAAARALSRSLAESTARGPFPLSRGAQKRLPASRLPLLQKRFYQMHPWRYAACRARGIAAR